MAKRVRAHDWSATPLGRAETWPPDLRAMVDTVIGHGLPMALLAGPDLINIYNDGYAALLSDRHPMALATAERELWPEDFLAARPVMERVLAGETIRLADEPADTRHWSLRNPSVYATLSPFRDRDGDVAGVMVTLLDLHSISDSRLAQAERKLKREEERQTFLLGELQHRVRNILAVLQSIMRRSNAGHPTVEDYVQHLEGRLGALARVQVLLTHGTDAPVDLEDLVRDELLSQAADETRITIAGPAVGLSPKAAEVLTLALHELATNAVKFGALSRADATIDIGWRIEDRRDEPWLSLSWIENGVPIAGVAPRNHGFGTELITDRIAYELKGYGELRMCPGGIQCMLEFPLRQQVSSLDT